MRSMFPKSMVIGPVFVILLTTNLHAQGDFLYTNNSGGVNMVSGFSVGANGELTPVPGSPFPTGGTAGGFGNDIAVSSQGNFLYVSNSDTTISAFSIDPGTGALIPVAGSPFPTNTGILGSLSFATSPNGNLLFAGNNATGLVVVFNIAANGALTPLSGSPSSGSNLGISAIEVSPDNKFLFVGVQSSDRIAAFNVGPDGALTPVPGSPFIAGTQEGSVVSLDINCDSNLLFVGDSAGEVTVFSIGADGALANVPGSPFPITLIGSQAISFSPISNLLFIANSFTRNASSFNVSPAGSLSLVPGSSIFLGDNADEDQLPIDVDTNRDGTLLYVMNANSTIHVLGISPSGILSLAPGSPFFNTGGSGFGAMIAAFPAKNCPTVVAFDICLQDDGNGHILKFNSMTGNYEFIKCGLGGFTLNGQGAIGNKRGILSLIDFRADRRVQGFLQTNKNKGTAAVQVPTNAFPLTVNDSNTTNNTCLCPNN